MARVQVLAISKRGLLSATAISRPHCFTSAALIDARESVEEENVGKMLHKCITIKQLKQVHLQILISYDMRSYDADDDININSNSNYSLLADKLMLLSPDLISFYYANKVFLDLPSNPCLTSYNTLIKCSIGKSDNIAASAYNIMRKKMILPDRFTFAFLFKTFASFERLKSGKTMHGHVIKLGFVSDTFVMNSLLEFYFKFVLGRNQLRAVKKVFNGMPDRDIVSWNTMISGLAYFTMGYEALLVFNDMLLSSDHRSKPDQTTLISILSACSQDSFFEQGKWLDTYIKENKLALSRPLGNALIDMFVSSGDRGKAKEVFKIMSKRCAITLREMMSGLVSGSFYKEALVLFDTMCCCSVEKGGVKPDVDIFKLLLSAYSLDGMQVGDWESLFKAINKMVHGFGVKPNRADYESIIRILNRAGWVEAAMMLAESLPWEPSHWVWAHVLYSCQIHENMLLDSWIRKIGDVNSKQDHPTRFMKCTLESYVDIIFDRTHNDDVNNAKSMVESLISKLPSKEHADELNHYLEDNVKRNALTEAYRQKNSSVKLVLARETIPQHHGDDDVYKAVESLHRQLFDLHDQANLIYSFDDC